MGSVTMHSAKLPSIKLDTTLTDLYRRANPDLAKKRVAQVLCGVNSGIGLSADFPRNATYLYQDSPFNNETRDDLDSTNVALQRSLAMKYLSLVPQRDAFISGSSVVILFHSDQTLEQREHDRREAESTLSVLDETMRPELVFCPGPAAIPLREHAIDMIAYKLALDSLAAYPLTVDLDTHWFLNSKAGLARSGLPTPKATILETTGCADAADLCCDICRADQREIPFIPPGCKDSRGRWFNRQMEAIVGAVRERSVPFVLKNQQTFGGAGTWVVKTEAEKESLLHELASDNGVLRKLLSQLTAANNHLAAGTIVLTDVVADPIGDYGLTFFATTEGGAIFLAVSEQVTDESNAWVGSTIGYGRQELLRKKFTPLMEKVASWLAQHGYYGPAGVDILETGVAGQTESHTGEATMYHIVDLNVRTSGSLCLPLLRGHFVGRGLQFASTLSVAVMGSRADFIEHWKDGFESGRMCILSWYEDPRSGKSIADIVIGAESMEILQRDMKRVKDDTEEVTF